MEPITLGGSFTMSRVLGTVPVEEDGSAYMRLPAMRSLYFVALDKDDLSVKRMQSFLTLQPGEKTGCVGCHERRALTAPTTAGMSALTHRPHRIEPIDDVPEVFDFPRDVQPILDKYCVGCHNSDHAEGGVNLCGDHTQRYSVGYLTLVERGLISDGRNRPFGNRAPRTIGSSASKLLEYLDDKHHAEKATDLERKKVRLWIESSATYPGTYAALGTGMYTARLPAQMLVKRCGDCHSVDPRKLFRLGKRFLNIETACNLSRPDRSPILLAPLAKSAGGQGRCGKDVFKTKKDPCYQAVLRAIEQAGKRLEKGKRFDMPGFMPDPSYVREMKRFGILPDDHKPDDPIDVYEVDQKYWESFWHEPVDPDGRPRGWRRFGPPMRFPGGGPRM
jgi:hypothetical protein